MGITGGQIRNPCKSPVDKGFQKYIIIWFFKIQECLLFVFFSSSFRWVQPCFMNEDILVLEEACFHSLSDPAISKLQNQHSNLPVQAITPENWIMDIQTILWSWGKKTSNVSAWASTVISFSLSKLLRNLLYFHSKAITGDKNPVCSFISSWSIPRRAGIHLGREATGAYN